jgi:hypothetical protein
LAGLGVHGLFELARYVMLKDVPDFLGEMVEAAKESPAVTRKLGSYQGYAYEYNEKDLVKDTLAYQIEVRGATAQLTLTGYALKQGDSWLPVHIDTLYSEN